MAAPRNTQVTTTGPSDRDSNQIHIRIEVKIPMQNRTIAERTIPDDSPLKTVRAIAEFFDSLSSQRTANDMAGRRAEAVDSTETATDSDTEMPDAPDAAPSSGNETTSTGNQPRNPRKRVRFDDMYDETYSEDFRVTPMSIDGLSDTDSIE